MCPHFLTDTSFASVEFAVTWMCVCLHGTFSGLCHGSGLIKCCVFVW